jgi:hypothetical protein
MSFKDASIAGSGVLIFPRFTKDDEKSQQISQSNIFIDNDKNCL